MSIEFTTLPDARALLITARGHVSGADVDAMRLRTVELTTATGFRNYIVDISDLRSIARGDTFATFDLGDRFRETGVPYRTFTAVIMPSDSIARQQAEFLHTVEVNRGRGELRYVLSVAEAIEWFADDECR